jgi:hypothetical protein
MTTIKEKLRIWQERFVLDPELPSGIRWKSLATYQNKQTMAGHLVDGYYRVKTGGKTYGCSHIVLALSGFLPREGETEVDQIDGNSLNNAVSNLRWCTRSVNEQNKSARGKSGIKYVRLTPQGRWRAGYQALGSRKSTYVGTYDTPYEAHLAALAHRLEHHWNP